MKIRGFLLAALGLLPLLAACAGMQATPQIIASAPREAESGLPIAEYTAPANNRLVVYSASLELEVRDVDAAAERATQLAYDYGGYLAESTSWRREGQTYTTLTLAVPVAYYEDLYAALLRLGTPRTERQSGDVVPRGRYEDEWNTFSHITVSLRPAPALVRLPPLPETGWSPMRTFWQAFGFVAGILQVLVDILIWVVVVAGPFVLIGLGVRALVRRWRGRNFV